MKTERSGSMAQLIISMIIMGTVGLFRRFIPLPSGVICMTRGFSGALILSAVMLVRRERLSPKAIKENLLLLVASGALLGINWVLIFEGYRYTSVAVVTLLNYMAPLIVVLLSLPVLGEKLSGMKLFCVLLAFFGVVLVSGVVQEGALGPGELKGVVLSFISAFFYAGLVLLNKKMKPISTYDRSIIQLATAGAVMLIYNLVSGAFVSLRLDGFSGAMLAVVCLVHTGLAYSLYYGCMGKLQAQVLALFSYIDPVVAVLCSAVILHEGMTLISALGAVMVLLGAVLSELPEKQKLR